MDHTVAECRSALATFYAAGGRVVVIASEGVFTFAAEVLSPLFNADWKFKSYTAFDFELTLAGADVLGGLPGAPIPYCKANMLQVPAGESLVLPTHDFEADYGYPIDDRTSEYYDPEDAAHWRTLAPPTDCPIAFQKNEEHGGELGYVGFVSFICSKQQSQLVEHLIRRVVGIEAERRAD